jgi:NTP pyrophosphatase (non-canonical NTP hydrolase)
MMAMKPSITIRYLQQYIKDKDFKPELKEGYFMKLVEEVGELAEVIRKNQRYQGDDSETIKGTVEEELYDVLYYVIALANVYNVDLEECCRLKEEINKERTDH